MYHTKLKTLENESGDMMSTGLSDKTKLEIVSFALPLGLRQLIKATLPTPDEGTARVHDTWEAARIRTEMTCARSGSHAAM